MVTKENKIKIIKYIWYTAGTVCLLMAPVASYFMFEYVTGNLDTVPYYMAALNIGWIYVLYLALFAVTGRTEKSLCPLPPASYMSFPWRRPLCGLPRPPHHAVGCDGIQDSHDRIRQLRIFHHPSDESSLCPDSAHERVPVVHTAPG